MVHNIFGKWLSPHQGIAINSEPNPTHTSARGINRTNSCKGIRNELSQISRMGGQVGCQGFKIIQLSVHVRIQMDAVLICILKTSLENAEKTMSTGNSNNHASQFTKDLSPGSNQNSLSGAKILKYVEKSCHVVWQEVYHLMNGVNEPTQNDLHCLPRGISLLHLFDRDMFLLY